MYLVQNKNKNTLVRVLRTQITFVTHSSPSCYVTLCTQVIRLNSGNLSSQKTESCLFIIFHIGLGQNGRYQRRDDRHTVSDRVRHQTAASGAHHRRYPPGQLHAHLSPDINNSLKLVTQGLLSSANKAWVGHRNAGLLSCPSVGPSVNLTCM